MPSITSKNWEISTRALANAYGCHLALNAYLYLSIPFRAMSRANNNAKYCFRDLKWATRLMSRYFLILFRQTYKTSFDDRLLHVCRL